MDIDSLPARDEPMPEETTITYPVAKRFELEGVRYKAGSEITLDPVLYADFIALMQANDVLPQDAG